MQRHDVTGLEQIVAVLGGMHALCLDLISRHKLVEGIDLHVEALGDTRHITTDVSEGEDTELLAFQLRACLAVEEVAHGIDEQSEDELCHRIGVLTGRVLHHDAFLLGISRIDRVVARTGTHHDLQLGSSIEHLLRDFVGAHDHSVSVLHSIQQLLLVGIFL